MENLRSDVLHPGDLGSAFPIDRVFSKTVIKRGLDIVIALSALLVLAPLLILLIRLVKRDGGAAFYAQRRIGYDGQEFRCFKFRTMVPNAECRLQSLLSADPALRESYEKYWKLKDDPRVTPIGHKLRRLSLDELPQLINVVRGEMSIVGPRPRSVIEMKHMEETCGSTSLYTTVRPGMTGLWQVSGRNLLTLAQKAWLDDNYIRTWSPGGDLVLMLRTVGVVLSGHGAH